MPIKKDICPHHTSSHPLSLPMPDVSSRACYLALASRWRVLQCGAPNRNPELVCLHYRVKESERAGDYLHATAPSGGRREVMKVGGWMERKDNSFCCCNSDTSYLSDCGPACKSFHLFCCAWDKPLSQRERERKRKGERRRKDETEKDFLFCSLYWYWDWNIGWRVVIH